MEESLIYYLFLVINKELKMETRRNFLKKIGFGGILSSPISKILLSENKPQFVYGSDLIKNVLDEYKLKRPVKYEKYSILSEVDSIFLKNNDTRLICGYPELREFDKFDVLVISNHLIPNNQPDWKRGSTLISTNKKGFYLVEHPHCLEFREENGIFADLDDVITYLPNPEEVFRPYKELHKLVWGDLFKRRSHY